MPIIVAVLAVGAFLQWGPIGLGNGPLRMGMLGGAEFGGVSSRLPVALLTPIGNQGDSPVVIDGVQLLGNGSFPAPHVLAMETMSSTDCGDFFPIRTTAAGFVLTGGCDSRPLGRLYSRPVGNENSANVFAAFEVSPPARGGCWLMTRIVIRYHVGIRHYVATDPFVVAWCAGSVSRAQRITSASGM